MEKTCKDCWHNDDCSMSQEGCDFDPDSCPYNPDNESEQDSNKELDKIEEKKTLIESYENFQFEDNKIGIDDVSITYLQNSDCSGKDGEDSVQSIIISTRNNGCARFINIKTDSWSINDIDELVKLIEDFKKRAELCGGNC